MKLAGILCQIFDNIRIIKCVVLTYRLDTIGMGEWAGRGLARVSRLQWAVRAWLLASVIHLFYFGIN